uniref:PHD-type domain-containing protein n=2 Tax=Mesocestoides corti TaxID=53468 RepID=A0A5K3F598_MESCO
MEITASGSRNAPLFGKKIYMHYETGTRPHKDLEKVLQLLKAEIVQFFDRKVDYVITNVPSSRIPPSSGASTPQSEKSLKENVDPALGSSSEKSQKSPYTPATPRLLTDAGYKPRGVTRGRAMLLAAAKTPKLSIASPSPIQSISEGRHFHDLLMRARQFGIKILTINAVKKWIRKLPEDIKEQLETGESPFLDFEANPEPDDPERDRICCVRHLTAPCIKIVDLNGRTRPYYMEETNYLGPLWQAILNPPPQLNRVRDSLSVCDAPALGPPQGAAAAAATPEGCTTPQASVGHNPSTNQITSLRTTQATKAGPGGGSRKHSQQVPIRRQSFGPRTPGKRKRPQPQPKTIRDGIAEPSGYCECCAVSYNNLYEHIHGKDHTQFAENPENFRSLDQFFSELPSMEEVLAKARAKFADSTASAATAPPDQSPVNIENQESARPPAGVPLPPTEAVMEPKSPQKKTSEGHPNEMMPDFHLIPPPPTPSVPQDYAINDTAAPQLFSDPENESDVGNPNDAVPTGAKSTSLLPSPTTQFVPNLVSTVFSLEPLSPPPGFADLPGSSPTEEAPNIVLPPPEAFADDCGFEVSEPGPCLRPPPPLIPIGDVRRDDHNIPIESTAPSPLFRLEPGDPDPTNPALTRSPSFCLPLIGDARAAASPSQKASVADGDPQSPPSDRVKGWQQAIGCLSVKSPTVSPSKRSGLKKPPPTNLSPILPKMRRRCGNCHRVHLPDELPLHLQLQHGEMSDRTRDTRTQTHQHPSGLEPSSSTPVAASDVTKLPSCALPTADQRSLRRAKKRSYSGPASADMPKSFRSSEHKATSLSLKQKSPNPPFPCGICGENVNYKVWSIRCSSCRLWIHASCSQMELAQIRQLPKVHTWTCPVCRAR